MATAAFSGLRLIKLRRAGRKVWTAIPRGKIKLIIIAETISIPDRRKPRTHGRESMIDLFDKSRIILEICAPLTSRSG